VEVQIFGVRKSADTRAALRFFSERRIRTHFVNLDEKEPSPRELERFVRKFGVATLIDRESKRFAELGLGASQLSDARWIEKLALEPRLLRLPLVRWQHEVTIGDATETWKAWCAR
jgi:arsenate reductase-like glutaredoxin family protein